MDWSVYDLQDEFTTEEVAYLWIEKEPQYKFCGHPPAVTNLIKTLNLAIDRGELRAKESGGYERIAFDDELSLSGFGSPQYGGIYTPTQYHVTRHDLRQWAERRGQYPAFLFQDRREPASASCNATSGDWRAEALSAVGANIQKSNANATGSDIEQETPVHSKPIDTAPDIGTSQKSLYRLIGGLILLNAELMKDAAENKRHRYKQPPSYQPDSINMLSVNLIQLFEQLGLETRGMNKSNLYRLLAPLIEGDKRLLKEISSELFEGHQ